ncbi:rRNA-binding ribosome biosynthesis protein utp25 [Coemansia thaxteri]|uniref:U3 small nucleolar RNA-associated protein 25 n=1 Tax=Coemansia thaxteri TaxID=2663907 RepID=A0A9W8BLN4_9FUNG|nr:rRNA-binding ribosome biosynthesis protein utp25 [Coemansia thaxteri]
MPPAKKSRKLSRKDLNQLKEYGELDPFSNMSEENGLDDLISKAISRSGFGRLPGAPSLARGKAKGGVESGHGGRGRPRPALSKSTQAQRPDAYTRLLKSLPAASNVLSRRAAAISDDEELSSGGSEEEDGLTAGDHTPEDSDTDARMGEDIVDAGGKEPDQLEYALDEVEHGAGESSDDDSDDDDGGENDSTKTDAKEIEDYMEKHFSDDDSPLMHKRLAAVAQKEYTQVEAKEPLLGQAVLYCVDGQGARAPNPSAVISKLAKPLHSINDGQDLTAFQQRLFGWFDQYLDVVYAGRSFDKDDEITSAYALHAMNHVMKSKDLERRNRAKLTKAHAEGVDAGELRDQGFTRPRVLIVLPFRNCAYKVVEKLYKLASAGQDMSAPRFSKEYGPGDSEESIISKRKPDDFRKTFAGNIDDNFRIGVQLYRKSARLFTDFYHSDIILASPIGLRMATGSEGDERRDFDFLSSIEVMIVDQCDALLMQNWEHVSHVFSHLNRTPKKDHGCDFSRIRNWYLEGTALHRRQTILISEYMTPEIQALFNNNCRSIEGKVRIKPIYPGAIADVVAQVPQTFKRLTVKRLQSVADDRFAYFTDSVLPELEKSTVGDKHTLVFVPSYFDYVRIRNYCRDKSCSFAAISEYSTASEAMGARRGFYAGELRFMLYSERAHFYHRYPIKGIHRVVFYSLPEHPLYYSELLNLMLTSNDGTASSESFSCTVLYTKYDQLKVERIVGTRLAPQLLNGDRPQYTFA